MRLRDLVFDRRIRQSLEKTHRKHQQLRGVQSHIRKSSSISASFLSEQTIKIGAIVLGGFLGLALVAVTLAMAAWCLYAVVVLISSSLH